MPGPSRPQRIGILGGTFDPPHAGHAAAARAALATLELDRLLLMVANDPWQKSPVRHVTPAEDRFAMTQALAHGIPGAEASRMEIERGGPSYTVMTAEQILAEAQAAGRATPDLYLVVGADLAAQLDTWERVADLQRLVTVALVSRPSPLGPRPPVPAGWRTVWVDGPRLDISSSGVRQALAEGKSIEEMVPSEVVRCIRRRTLYAVGR